MTTPSTPSTSNKIEIHLYKQKPSEGPASPEVNSKIENIKNLLLINKAQLFKTQKLSSQKISKLEVQSQEFDKTDEELSDEEQNNEELILDSRNSTNVIVNGSNSSLPQEAIDSLLTSMDENKVLEAVELKKQCIYEMNKNGSKLTNLSMLWMPGFERYHQKLSSDKIIKKITKAQNYINSINATYSQIIKSLTDKIPKNSKIDQFNKKVGSVLKISEKVLGGSSGTYFTDEFVISPLGEGFGEVHNPKGIINLRHKDWLVEKSLERYQEPIRKAAAYCIALAIGIDQVTPPTILRILDCPPNVKNKQLGFNFITDQINEIEHDFVKKLKPSYERLSSVQEKIEGAKTYYQFNEEIVTTIKKENLKVSVTEVLKEKISFHDFMLICCWMIITGEYDGNLGNVIVYQDKKGKYGKLDENSRYRLMKIDEGQTFPQINDGKEFRNELIEEFEDYANMSLDLNIKLLIKHINIKEILIILSNFKLNKSCNATEIRIKTFQALIEEFPQITIIEAWYRIQKISNATSFDLKDNPVFADLTAEELEEENILNPSPRALKRQNFADVKKYLNR